MFRLKNMSSAYFRKKCMFFVRKLCEKGRYYQVYCIYQLSFFFPTDFGGVDEILQF